MSATCCAVSPNCSALSISERPSRLRSLISCAGNHLRDAARALHDDGIAAAQHEAVDLAAIDQRDLAAVISMRDVVRRIHDGGDHDVLRLPAREAIERRRVVDALPADAMAHEAGARGGRAALGVAAQLDDVGDGGQRGLLRRRAAR